MKEVCAVLVGRRQGRVWLGCLRRWTRGGAASVELDWAWALEREEARGDVLGFFHTHPPGLPAPSARDVRTLRAWVICLGKPLVCLVRSGDRLSATLFTHGEDEGRPLAEAERFPGGRIVAVEGGG